MTSRVKAPVRKQPKQERSRSVVDALVEATARLVTSQGFEALTTNSVAKAAGVSIGSLYQYFPSKEALITSVMNQWADLTTREAVEAFQTLEHAPLQQGIARLVQLVMQATGRHPVLNKALLEQVHRAGFREALEHTNRRFEDLFTRWLEGRTDELAVDDLPMASHLVLRSMIALCENALLHRPERLTSKRFATHLERLALAYLTQK